MELECILSQKWKSMLRIKRNKKCNLFLLKSFTHTIVCVIFISEGNNKNKLLIYKGVVRNVI